MATPNISPRQDGEGNIGTSTLNWLKGWFQSLFVSGNITDGTNNVTVANLKTLVDASADMAKSVYDTDDDGIVDASETLNDGSSGGGNEVTASEARSHIDSTSNPHSVTKTQIGLSNVDNIQQLPLSYLDTDGTLSANSDLKVPSQKAVKTYSDALLAANDAMIFKGIIDCSGNPNYPAADAGDTYRISVAGKIGGVSGVSVEVGDIIICITDSTSSGDQAAVGANWSVIQVNIDGAVVAVSPFSSVDDNIPKYSGTTGRIIEDSGVAIADVSNHLSATNNPHSTTANQIATEDSGVDVQDALNSVESDISSLKTSSLTFVIDGGGSEITTGIKGDLLIPFGCTITKATLLADQSGSIVIDVWKDTYANYPATDADSITASAPPTITTATKSQDSTLTGWTKTITAGDILRFNVDSVTTIQRVTLSLEITRS